jgi:hypothetical protein
MSKNAPVQLFKWPNPREWARFECLIAAMLADSILKPEFQSSARVFRVYDDLVSKGWNKGAAGRHKH